MPTFKIVYSELWMRELIIDAPSENHVLEWIKEAEPLEEHAIGEPTFELSDTLDIHVEEVQIENPNLIQFPQKEITK